jgi:hypothetical protein
MATRVTIDDLVGYFRSERIDFVIGTENRLLLTVQGHHVALTVQVAFIYEKEIISLHTVYPFRIPPEKTADALEVAARINWGLLFAACELNPDSGAIRFRSVLLVDDAPFNREQFSTLFATGCSTADRYAPAFLRLCEGADVGTAMACVGEQVA